MRIFSFHTFDHNIFKRDNGLKLTEEHSIAEEKNTYIYLKIDVNLREALKLVEVKRCGSPIYLFNYTPFFPPPPGHILKFRWLMSK